MRAAAMLALLLTGCGYDWTVIPKTAPDASSPSDAAVEVDASPPIPCAGDGACAKNAFCAFPDRLCGKGMPGTCRKSPPSKECNDAGLQPVCACSGKAYQSRCQADVSADDVTSLDACNVPLGKDKCGYLFCDAGTPCGMDVLDGGLVEYRCGP